MKSNKTKLIAFLIMLLIFTVSCEFLNQPNNETTVDVDAAIQKAVIETKAAATLQAANDQTQNDADDADDGDDVDDADSPEPTNTTAPPTNTPETIASATLTPTPTQTPTATVQPTPTLPPNDPTSTLGDPTFEDDFENSNYWLQYDDANSVVNIQDNALRFTKKAANNYSLWTASWPTLQDYYLEIVAQVPGPCSGKDEWGVLFRTPDATKGHIFTITCDGYYRVRLWDGTDMVALVDRAQSDHINTGSGAFNRIGVKAVDDEITIYVNGFFLATFNSATYDGVGPYGVTINAVDTANLTVHFSELRYWDLSN